MKILLVSATAAEIKPLLNALNLPHAAEGVVQTARHKNTAIDLLVTGVGMTATAYHLGRNLNNSYDLALNLGLAGSFAGGPSLGAVVNVVKDRFSELGAEDGDVFLPVAALNLGVQDEFAGAAQTGNAAIDKLEKVSGITVNTVHGHADSIQKIAERLRPQTESMEGAAFLMCCALANVPGIQLRAISNRVERRNREAWIIPEALKNLNQKILEVLHDFN